MLACGNNEQTPKVQPSRPAITEEPVANPCEGKDDGDPCGMDRQCVEGECLINICGDGIVAGMEQCDDGNQVVDDGCTPSCRMPAGSCGDGTVDKGEECDDGNSDNADFCSNVCVRQLCRNGVLDVNEECDDGNTDPTDGCNNSCHKVVCGDGKAEEQEECDDGNRSETDGCSNACTVIMCGNDRVDVGEACDRSRVKAASGKPPGDPLPDGAVCAPDCKSVAMDDQCKKCVEGKKECRDLFAYDVQIGDVFAGCYQTDFKDPVNLDAKRDPTWVERCNAVVECARRNRCDLLVPRTDMEPTYDITTAEKVGSLAGCFCGEVAPNSGTYDFSLSNCYVAPAGKCVQQIYDATDCADGYCVEGALNNTTAPSYYAFYLSLCQQQYCFKECF